MVKWVCLPLRASPATLGFPAFFFWDGHVGVSIFEGGKCIPHLFGGVQRKSAGKPMPFSGGSLTKDTPMCSEGTLDSHDHGPELHCHMSLFAPDPLKWN